MLLYIEDNKAIGENVVAYLESEGWQVQWEKNGKDGLAAAME
jgi:DNA-binding response OmpR family regulator